ncbi:unnamed protein product [Bemisia tabaci]|uniref:Uncharacterized protein n=1 Tax=Bemisia tabaci TaxID=7038 RepID=A0A9P0F0Q5_BEMTA|nr:unnamed protein product [Bemisia tabaci]
MPKFSVLSRYGALVLVSLVINLCEVEAPTPRGGNVKGSSPSRRSPKNAPSPPKGCPPSPLLEKVCQESISNLYKAPDGTCLDYPPERCAVLAANGQLEQCKCTEPGHDCFADKCTQLPQCTIDMIRQENPKAFSGGSGIRGQNGKPSWQRATAAVLNKLPRGNSVKNFLAKSPTFARSLTGGVKKLSSSVRGRLSRSRSGSKSKGGVSRSSSNGWLSDTGRSP